MRPAPLAGRAALAAVAGAALVAGLAGCTAAQDSPTVGSAQPVASGSVAAPRPTSSGPPAVGAEAEQELARFDRVNRATMRRDRAPGGRAFIDALVAAGFEKADMQVTRDRTTIGLAVPSVQFSVLLRGACLIGQHGAASGYRGIVAAPVDGRCLIGSTRPIDW